LAVPDPERTWPILETSHSLPGKATPVPNGNDPRWELAAQPLPAIEFDQRQVW
jgi:hypothetical protein